MGLRSSLSCYRPDLTFAFKIGELDLGGDDEFVALIDFLHAFEPFECGGVILELVDGIVSASCGWECKGGKSDNTQGRNGACEKA